VTEIATTPPALSTPAAAGRRSPLYLAWRRFAANRAALGAGIVLVVIILMAVFAPLVSKTGPNDQAFLTTSLAFPSAEH